LAVIEFVVRIRRVGEVDVMARGAAGLARPVMITSRSYSPYFFTGACRVPIMLLWSKRPQGRFHHEPLSPKSPVILNLRMSRMRIIKTIVLPCLGEA
jgi:hypothetical protein